MRTIYLECAMGAAGDMLMSALLELHPDPDAFLEKMNGLGIPGVKLERQSSEKCGILGTHIAVTVNGAEEYSKDAVSGTAAEIHAHAHDHEHDSDHDDAHEHAHDHDDGHEHAHDDAHDHDHAHTHDSDHDHAHAHDDAHAHDHDHAHTHDHDSEHAHHHHHSHAHPADIDTLIRSLPIPEDVQTDALAVYGLIAEAEGHAHGKPVSEIHYHEVGTMDAVADVVGVCLLMHELGAEQILASAVQVGSGHVHCAHGILPVPAPATAYILRDVPVYSTDIQGELCTPTGAALLKHFVSSFGPMPVMRAEKIGYGMGNKNFTRANCVRAVLGETEQTSDTVVELACNLDDMTPEDLGYAADCLLEAGALDVWMTPVQMKKQRPGVLLSCLTKPEDRQRIVELIFHNTTTLGIRETEHHRYTLRRETGKQLTALGEVTVKTASGYGVQRRKIEHEELKRLAKERECSVPEIRAILAGENKL